MNRVCTFLTGASLGAGVMYFFDPLVGNRRRSLARDQMIHALNRAEHAADVALRDMQNRAYGTAHELRSMITGAGAHPDDETLVNRVRSKMGRYISHPSAIEVSAHAGTVRLRGPILADEVDDLISAVKAVRGVEEIEDELEVHESAEGVSALQGGRQRTGEMPAWRQETLSPTMRAILGLAGGVLALDCMRRQTLTSAVLGTAGAGLIYQALRGTGVDAPWFDESDDNRRHGGAPRRLSGYSRGSGGPPPEVQERRENAERQSRPTQETRVDQPI